MIQRIQSLYMLLSVVLCVVCLCTPLGHFTTAVGERYADLYNLWVHTLEDGGHMFVCWALFVILVLSTTLTFTDILLYRRRALQMRVLVFSMILLLCYYGYFTFFVLTGKGDTSFTPSVTSALPLISIILDYLAFRGIMKDEMLVRSLDRLR